MESWKDEVPVVLVTQDQVDASLQCSICLEDLKLDESAMKLSCCHVYHEPCISPWLDKHSICPNCRRKVISRNETENLFEDENMVGLLSALERFFTDLDNVLQAEENEPGTVPSTNWETVMETAEHFERMIDDSEDEESSVVEILDENNLPSSGFTSDQESIAIEVSMIVQPETFSESSSQDSFKSNLNNVNSLKRKKILEESDEDTDCEVREENMRLDSRLGNPVRFGCGCDVHLDGQENKLQKDFYGERMSQHGLECKENGEDSDCYVIEDQFETRKMNSLTDHSHGRYKRSKKDSGSLETFVPDSEESSDEEINCDKNLVTKSNGVARENTVPEPVSDNSSEGETDFEWTEIGNLITKLYDIVKEDVGDEDTLRSFDEQPNEVKQEETDASDVIMDSDEDSDDKTTFDSDEEGERMHNENEASLFHNCEETEMEHSKTEMNHRQKRHQHNLVKHDTKPSAINNKETDCGFNLEVQKAITELWDIVTQDPLFKLSQLNNEELEENEVSDKLDLESESMAVNKMDNQNNSKKSIQRRH